MLASADYKPAEMINDQLNYSGQCPGNLQSSLAYYFQGILAHIFFMKMRTFTVEIQVIFKLLCKYQLDS